MSFDGGSVSNERSNYARGLQSFAQRAIRDANGITIYTSHSDVPLLLRGRRSDGIP